jgi:hypothetical protein
MHTDICDILLRYCARSLAYRLAFLVYYDAQLISVRNSNKYRYTFIDQHYKSYNRIYKYYRYGEKYITQKYDDYDLYKFKYITYRIYGIKFSIGYYCGSDMIYNRFSFARLLIGNKKYELYLLQISPNGYMKYCMDYIYYEFADYVSIELGYEGDYHICIDILIGSSRYIISKMGIYILNYNYNRVPLAEDISVSFAHLTQNSAKIWHKNGGLLADINYYNSKIVSYAIYHENGDIIKKMIYKHAIA